MDTIGLLLDGFATALTPGNLLWALLGVVLGTFVVTTLVDEPGTAIAIVVILAVSTVIDVLWKRQRPAASPPSVTTDV